MTTVFDHIATHYDQEFSQGSIGSLQRQKVWEYLDMALPERPLSILELNCGTGEDAIYLAKKGHHVTATDLSEPMLTVAQGKARKADLRITFQLCDLNQIEKMNFGQTYDVIFSNFGGLNCINSLALRKLSRVASLLLNPGGHFIAVIMPSFCLWESFYFLIKGRLNNAYRRAGKGPLQVYIQNQVVETWYYSPKSVMKIMTDEFDLVHRKPIGFFLPPSYLQTFFNRKKGLLNLLNRLEHVATHLGLLSGLSDHFLIDFEVKKASES